MVETEQLADSRGLRSKLAYWLTDDHPLTSRVIVNRIWQRHFGRGISASTSDFGVMGESPTHPELLEWLAVEFNATGQSLKKLHRLIVTSETYCRASRSTEPTWSDKARSIATVNLRSAQEADPENELFAYFPRKRLEGESARDAMLSVAGLLNREQGGPGVMPPLAPEIVETLLPKQWTTTEARAQHHRRSIYVFARRNLRYPMFDVFDRPDANASCACRDETTTATQSLLMLNSRLTLMAAKQLAADTIRHTGGDRKAALDLAVLRCFGRSIRPDERLLFRQIMGR